MVFSESKERIILVVDSEVSSLRYYRRVLEQAGYQVLLAKGAAEASRVIESKGLPHLILLDLHMPGIDGFAFARSIVTFSDVPIIFLTTDEEADKACHALGDLADDCIRKPVSEVELVARIRRSLQRVGAFDYVGAVICVDDYLQIDLTKKQVLLPTGSAPLTSLETKLLFILMRDPDVFVPSRTINQRLWGVERLKTKRLQVMIHRLRQKIEPDPRRPRYLITKREVGYKFRRPSPNN